MSMCALRSSPSAARSGAVGGVTQIAREARPKRGTFPPGPEMIHTSGGSKMLPHAGRIRNRADAEASRRAVRHLQLPVCETVGALEKNAIATRDQDDSTQQSCIGLLSGDRVHACHNSAVVRLALRQRGNGSEKESCRREEAEKLSGGNRELVHQR